MVDWIDPPEPPDLPEQVFSRDQARGKYFGRPVTSRGFSKRDAAGRFRRRRYLRP